MVLHEWIDVGGAFMCPLNLVPRANYYASLQFGSLITYGLAKIDSHMKSYQVCRGNFSLRPEY